MHLAALDQDVIKNQLIKRYRKVMNWAESESMRLDALLKSGAIVSSCSFC